jgi:hypothetical protein
VLVSCIFHNSFYFVVIFPQFAVLSLLFFFCKARIIPGLIVLEKEGGASLPKVVKVVEARGAWRRSEPWNQTRRREKAPFQHDFEPTRADWTLGVLASS